MDVWQPHFKLWWKLTAGAYLIGAFGLLVYWLVTDSGPYRLLDRLITSEHRDYTVHYPKVVFVVLLLALLVPLLVVRIAAGHRVRHVDPNNVMRF